MDIGGREGGDNNAVQPKSNRYKPRVENKLLKVGRGRESKELKNKSNIYEIFLYRCVKEDETEITLMMLFFYLLGHMPLMSFNL